MTDNANPVDTQPTDKTAKKRRSPGDIDQDILDAIAAGKKILGSAMSDHYNAALTKRVKPEKIAALGTALLTIADQPDGNLVAQVINNHNAIKSATKTEQDLGKQLFAKLRAIQKGAGNTYKQDQARRDAYLINKPDFGKDRETFEADAAAIIGLARNDTLDNIIAADLDEAQTLLDNWKQADADQKTAQRVAGETLAALRTAATAMTAIVTTIRVGADVVFDYHDKNNATARSAFNLQPDRPMQT